MTEQQLRNGFKAVYGESDEEYHAKARSGEYLSSHKLAEFRKSPRAYVIGVDLSDEPEEENPAFAFGRAAHCLILEGRDAFNERYVVSDGPINERTGKPYGRETAAYRAWRDSLADKAEPVSRADFEMIDLMCESVENHAEAMEILRGGMPELTVRGTMRGVPVQARFDAITNNNVLIDLKTTADIATFEKDFWKFGYNFQAAFYSECHRLAFGAIPDFYFIAVEKKVPYTVGVFRVSEETLARAVAENERLLEEYALCKATDKWPTRFEEVRCI